MFLPLFKIIFSNQIFPSHSVKFASCGLRYPGFPGLEEEYSFIIQSGLARILDLVKTAPDTNNKLDEIVLLEAIKVRSGEVVISWYLVNGLIIV